MQFFRWALSFVESAKLRMLRGNVGYVGAWVKFLRGLRGLRGSKYFLRGLRRSNIFLRGSIFLHGSTIFVWVEILLGSKFLRGSIFFVVDLKNIDKRFHNNISVVHYIRIEDMLNQHPISCNSSLTWFWRQYFAYFFHLHYV